LAFDGAVLAANILQRQFLKDALLSLGSKGFGFFTPVWSKELVDQARRNWEQAGLDPSQIDRFLTDLTSDDPRATTRLIPNSLLDAMRTTVPDKIALGTAVAGGAGFVITFEAERYTPDDCDEFMIEAVTPDAFMLTLYDESEEDFHKALFAACCKYRSPTLTFVAFLEKLRQDGASGIWFLMTERFTESSLNYRYDIYANENQDSCG
jgi:hypothetical protein